LRTPVCSYPIIVTHLSFNFLCLLLLYSIYLNGGESGLLCDVLERRLCADSDKIHEDRTSTYILHLSLTIN
jgi:hypothetical protein